MYQQINLHVKEIQNLLTFSLNNRTMLINWYCSMSSQGQVQKGSLMQAVIAVIIVLF